jgi:hypothetical protein
MQPVICGNQESHSQQNEEEAYADHRVMLPVSFQWIITVSHTVSHDFSFYLCIKNSAPFSPGIAKIGE